MLEAKSKLNAVIQNVIIGCVAGLLIGYNLKYIFNTIGASDLLWLMFFVLGPLIGYLSGRERQRYEKLKKEKEYLERDFDELQKRLQKSSEKYKILVEKINDTIFLISDKGKLLLFNSATPFLTGYSSSQLRKMNMSDLSFSNEYIITPDQYKLVNDIYQYKTVWKKKNNKPLILDIIVKKISYKNYKLWLHVGRVVKKENEIANTYLAEHLKLIHKYNLNDIESFFSSFYNRLIQPVNTTIKLLDYFNKNYPDEEDKCDSLLKKWDQSKNLLETILRKKARDETTTPSEWNLNEIIYQELNFLKTSMDTGTFVVETSLDKTIPPILGIGKNFSLAMGIIFKATVRSLKESSDEFLVSTHSINDKNIIEIKLSDNNNFKQQLAELIYPSVKEENSQDFSNIEIGLQVVQMYFDILNAEYDVGKEDNKTIIRMRFPIVNSRGKEDSEEFPKLYSDDDFLL